MINLGTVAAQVLAPGQSVLFDLTVLHTGCAEYHRNGSGAVSLVKPRAIYNVDFSADIGAAAAGTAQLSLMVDGEATRDGAMTSVTAAAGDLNSVAKPGVKVCVPNECCTKISVENTGTTTVTVANSLLSVNRVA